MVGMKRVLQCVIILMITTCLLAACAKNAVVSDSQNIDETKSDETVSVEIQSGETSSDDKTETHEASHTETGTSTEAVTETQPVSTTQPASTTKPTSSTEPSSSNQVVPNDETVVAETDPNKFVLTFVGDCTLGTMPTWMSYQGCFNKIVGNNYDFPFQNVKKYFAADDCTFINLESVLADSGTPANKQFTFRGPVSYINILTGSSVEFANLSNNHTYDFGEAGYITTKQTLEANKVGYVEQNKGTLYTTERGLKIGVYGVNFTLDKEDMIADVTALKSAGAEVIVAAAHWGEELARVPNNTQISIAHALIDAGVDIVWGHHAHVLQTIEEYKDGIIYYGTGNFSFGGNHNPSDKDTVVLRQQVVRGEDGTVKLGKLTVVPCSISSVTSYNNFQPTPYQKSNAGYSRVFSKLNRAQ